MNVERTIPLDRILPNPWQPRESEDPEHIKALALDIAAHGLLQKPVGRLVDGAGRPVGEWKETFDGGWSVQLAFGHSRLAAYKWLRDVQDNSNIPGDWAYLPVIIQELSDEQMCEMAISENLQRRDLTPIEVAKAMARYRSEFGKTSAEIGALFGLSDSAVRNKMRLVELPEAAQDALESGKITEHAARRLLGLKDMLPEKTISEIAVELTGREFDKPEQADWFITNKIMQGPRSKRLYYSYGEKATAGEGMWPLDWQVPAERELPDARTVAQMMKDPELAKGLKSNIVAGLSLLNQGKPVAGLDPDVMEALDHLVKLPACKGCHFSIKLDGSGFCGRKACWEYKRRIWIQVELRRLSAELNIPIYNPAVDGEVYEPLGSYGMGNRSEKIMQMHERGSGYLRLMAVKEQGGWWSSLPITKHKFIQVISISEESQAYVLQAKTEKERREAVDQQERRDRERGWEMQKRSQKFMEAVAAPEFGVFMFTLKPGILAVLFRVWARTSLPDDLDGNQKNNVMRAALGYQVLERLVQRELEFQGPVAVAEYLRGVAAEIGLFLPKNWMDMAREIESVSVETEVTA